MNHTPSKIPLSEADHKNHKNHDKHAGHTPEMFSRRFWVSLILTIPVVLHSNIMRELFGWRLIIFEGSEYLVPLFLGSIIFFYGGWVFIKGAYSELKAKLPGMMTLISLAILTAYSYSIYSFFAKKPDEALFWELSTLITVMLLGHWLEMKAVSGARAALKELSKLLPDTAEVVMENAEVKIVPLSELKEGDIALARPGAKIPADGVVLEGQSEVNEAMLTGESAPVAKRPGSQTIAGTINGDGALKIKITKIGERTFLAGVMRLVAEAEASKSRLQMLSDRAAFYLTLVAVAAGGLTFVFWISAKGDASFALERLVAVLVIACPHALGLAVPLVASISTTLAARHGFLVRQRLALEIAREISVILFDKTGTLTRGEYGVTRIIANEREYDENEILRLASSVDAYSEHFISKAIVAEAKKRNLEFHDVKHFQRVAGKGVRGEIKNEVIFAGGEAILTETNAVVPAELKFEIEKSANQGKTIIYVVVKSKLAGIIALADIIREESKEAVAELKKIGVETMMITGDSEKAARWAAEELGIDKYFARVLPGEKAEIVRMLQNSKSEYLNSKQFQNSNNQNFKRFGTLLFKIPRLFRISPRPPSLRSGVAGGDLGFRNYRRRRFVAMVGDGINDAPALVQADLGIAIGAGTNVAIESAGIILVRNDPRDIVKIIKLSRAAYSKMIQNLFWATGYNIIAIPLAAGILAAKGILLEPALAALFMSLSTVIVAVNAAFLKKLKFD